MGCNGRLWRSESKPFNSSINLHSSPQALRLDSKKNGRYKHPKGSTLETRSGAQTSRTESPLLCFKKEVAGRQPRGRSRSQRTSGSALINYLYAAVHQLSIWKKRRIQESDFWFAHLLGSFPFHVAQVSEATLAQQSRCAALMHGWFQFQ